MCFLNQFVRTYIRCLLIQNYITNSIANRLSSKDSFRFFDIAEIQGQKKNATENTISDGKEVSENRKDNETEYRSVEDPLNMYRTSSNGTTLFLRFQI